MLLAFSSLVHLHFGSIFHFASHNDVCVMFDALVCLIRLVFSLTCLRLAFWLLSERFDHRPLPFLIKVCVHMLHSCGLCFLFVYWSLVICLTFQQTIRKTQQRSQTFEKKTAPARNAPHEVRFLPPICFPKKARIHFRIAMSEATRLINLVTFLFVSGHVFKYKRKTVVCTFQNLDSR